jgi:hypothetical protein
MKSKVLVFASTVLALALLVQSEARASTSSEIQALKEEVRAMRHGQEEIKKDLAEIKKLLAQRPAAAPNKQAFRPADLCLAISSRSIGAGHAGGVQRLPVPFCKRHATTVMPIRQAVRDSGSAHRCAKCR